MKAEDKNILLEKLKKVYASKQISTAEYEMWRKVYGITQTTIDSTEASKIICPKCSATNVNDGGTVQGRPKYICNECGYHFTAASAKKASSTQNQFADNNVDEIEAYLQSVKKKSDKA